MLNVLIVGDVQVQYGPRDNGGDSDVVGKNFGVVGLGMPGCDRVDSNQADDRQYNHGCGEDATVPVKFCEALVLLGLSSVLGRHRVLPSCRTGATTCKRLSLITVG